MKRRQVLGLAAAAVTGTAGCLGSAGDGGSVTDNRTVVDETFAAGPTEPYCSAAGKDHFPPMSRRRSLLDGTPDGTDPAAVAAFVRGDSKVTGEVTIRPEKYATLAWRNKRIDLTERYDSARYYVGWVGGRDDGHTLLVVVNPDYTEVIHYQSGDNC